MLGHASFRRQETTGLPDRVSRMGTLETSGGVPYIRYSSTQLLLRSASVCPVASFLF